MSRKSAIWNFSREEIQERVDCCNSICDVLEAFGYKRTSGSMARVMKDVIDKYDIDISHFKPYRGGNSRPIYTLEEILVPNSPYTNIGRLKVRILNAGLMQYKCEGCGNEGEWNGRPLTLQLDHKNGDHSDHSLENLRFLCPNCHSQTETFSGKNAKYGARN